jgi:hypothetical protein
MKDFAKILEGLIPMLGQKVVDKLTAEFKMLAADQNDPWKQASLLLLAEAVEVHGLEGVALAQKAIHDLIDHKVPSIDWANPRTASDIVAKLQNAEAGDKSKTDEFFAKAGHVLGTLFSSLVQNLLLV